MKHKQEDISRRNFLKKLSIALGAGIVAPSLFVSVGEEAKAGGKGHCGRSYDCAGGGGKCGNSYECTGQGAGGSGKCGSSFDCAGGGGKCGSSYGCAGS